MSWILILKLKIIIRIKTIIKLIITIMFIRRKKKTVSTNNNKWNKQIHIYEFYWMSFVSNIKTKKAKENKFKKINILWLDNFNTFKGGLKQTHIFMLLFLLNLFCGHFKTKKNYKPT